MTKKWIFIPLLMVSVLHAQDTDTADTTISTTDANAVTNMDTNTVMTTNDVVADTNTTNITNTMITNDTVKTNSMYVEKVGYTVTNGDVVFASPMARFEVQGVDEQSGLQEILVSVDGGEYSMYKHPISFANQGEHTLNYQFIDRVGNVSYSKTFSVTVDSTVPRVLDLVLNPAPFKASGSEYIGPNTEFSFIAHDDLTGIAYIEYSTNGTNLMRFITNTQIKDLGYTNTSVFRLTYQATDMVSNVSPMKSQVLVVDATAPTVDVFAKAVEIDGIRYISSRDPVFVEAFDDDTKVDQILYSINGGEYVVYEGQIGINLTNAGEYTILAKALDVVGNESNPVEYKVVVDMLSPTGDAFYIGEVRSSEYDATAPKEAAMAETSADPTMMDEININEDLSLTANTLEEEALADPINSTTDEVTTTTTTTTTDNLEVPAGTEVDPMTTTTDSDTQ